MAIINENRLAGVRAEVVDFLKRLSSELENRMNIDILITEGCRSNAIQTAYYAQGRESLDKVNELRKKAGLPALTDTKQNVIITGAKAGQSAHNYCAAADVYAAKNGKLITDKNALNQYYAIVKELIAKQDEVVWGGNWTQGNDPPHFEWKHYRTLIKPIKEDTDPKK